MLFLLTLCVCFLQQCVEIKISNILLKRKKKSQIKLCHVHTSKCFLYTSSQFLNSFLSKKQNFALLQGWGELPAAYGILGLKYYASEFWTIQCGLVHFENVMESGSKQHCVNNVAKHSFNTSSFGIKTTSAVVKNISVQQFLWVLLGPSQACRGWCLWLFMACYLSKQGHILLGHVHIYCNPISDGLHNCDGTGHLGHSHGGHKVLGDSDTCSAFSFQSFF